MDFPCHRVDSILMKTLWEKIGGFARIAIEVEQLIFVMIAQTQFPAVGRDDGANRGPRGARDFIVRDGV